MSICPTSSNGCQSIWRTLAHPSCNGNLRRFDWMILSFLNKHLNIHFRFWFLSLTILIDTFSISISISISKVRLTRFSDQNPLMNHPVCFIWRLTLGDSSFYLPQTSSTALCNDPPKHNSNPCCDRFPIWWELEFPHLSLQTSHKRFRHKFYRLIVENSGKDLQFWIQVSLKSGKVKIGLQDFLFLSIYEFHITSQD
jgi:hypothetical protein